MYLSLSINFTHRYYITLLVAIGLSVLHAAYHSPGPDLYINPVTVVWVVGSQPKLPL